MNSGSGDQVVSPSNEDLKKPSTEISLKEETTQSTLSCPDEKTDKSGIEKHLRDSKGQPVDKNDPDKVIVRGVKGTVKWFSVFNGYGFINRSDTDEDIFVHIRDILQKDDRRITFALTAEEEVEFNVVAGLKGPKATEVTQVGGTLVNGTRIVTRRLMYPGRRMPPQSRGRKETRGRRPPASIAKSETGDESHDNEDHAPASGDNVEKRKKKTGRRSARSRKPRVESNAQDEEKKEVPTEA